MSDINSFDQIYANLIQKHGLEDITSHFLDRTFIGGTHAVTDSFREIFLRSIKIDLSAPCGLYVFLPTLRVAIDRKGEKPAEDLKSVAKYIHLKGKDVVSLFENMIFSWLVEPQLYILSAGNPDLIYSKSVGLKIDKEGKYFVYGCSKPMYEEICRQNSILDNHRRNIEKTIQELKEQHNELTQSLNGRFQSLCSFVHNDNA